jgi:NADH-quinone oxidoreductase subunit F
MDRSIIEADPHSILEGMAIGAYAVGASKGYVYVRIEYPLAIERLEHAVSQAYEYGLLGEDIFDSDFNFDVEIFQGAGAFVCGEETSLIASIEGRPAEPRVRPPFPVQSGLWGNPTNINNVETWSNVPAIEVPMGITLREIIYDIGGGIPYGKKLKAVQTGGPSGGFIPNHLLDMPVDYERLQEVGAIMGSGGMVVMDEDTCIVDIAKYFLEFTNDESCGKCTACREGSEVLLTLLNRISDGAAEETDLTLLEELGEAVREASMCGLGQTLPNPVLSTVRHFRDEYDAHIRYKRCPAAVCKGIISSPCQHSCPIDQDVPCYIGLIALGKFDEAVALVRRENPLPAVCGRVCTAPCEDKCRSGAGGGDAISIRALKRFLADYERKNGLELTPKAKERRPEKVAIIGSGPAGLTCGYYLALEGYPVTIFESLPVAGGMLAVGIPDYRLPKDILDYEIGVICKLGVEIRTNTTVGEDVQLSDLRDDYRAVFIATGAHKGLKLNIEGDDSPQVIDAVDFLRAVNLGGEVAIGEKIAVIGGGDAAVDAARVARRLGKNVKILYRRTKSEMPAAKEEIEELDREGIDIEFLVAPVRALSDNGRLNGIECIRLELGEVDKSGRRRPVPIEGSEFTVEIDTLIPAIGQQPDVVPVIDGNGLKLSRWHTVKVDPEILYTGVEGIFAGGDVVSGPATVVDAMAQGKTASAMIHNHIQGLPLKREYSVTRPAIDVEVVELSDEEIEGLHKPSMPTLPAEERLQTFAEVGLGFAAQTAVAEAKRCVRCDKETED